ncbi:hypothetical protein F2P56_029016 [Juglans regia]|uniref:Uncharacterized protein LOC108990885 isoform X2 n=2 Tax=Juglans regia TaxID=51240 RepID=A0A2I4EMC1_JUGRE|nr:uncharacterized protein LOC108990885 isoform X2 [Juglans regia]KAF5448482.1 hypothetical protein F2P56_029016 [Juglans regia]
MATVATTAPPPAPLGLLNFDSLVHIDMSTLSQSELRALSLCSPSAFDLRHPSQFLPPKIDRSIFNESAGSRRQTYSSPSNSTPTAGHRRRVAGLLPTIKLPTVLSDDPERVEDRHIISHLKHFLDQDPRFDHFDLTLPSISSLFVSTNHEEAEPDKTVSFGGERKRKRGRKPKMKVLQLEEGYGRGVVDVVNRNGVAVDLAALANLEDPYGEELRRRTLGMEREDELLGFMRELGGQWGSRRKKRKIVEAGVFGDALPVGWKLLLGIKRRDGRASIYCRRYISPTGQQFVSCKDAASYLLSFFDLSDARWASSQKGENTQQDFRLTSETLAGFIQKDENRQQGVISSSAPTRIPISSEQAREATLFGMENLADVQIDDIFECHKCSMTFDEKDSYLQHLLSYHQRTTRRYRLGSSVGDGVIIKDGKYECQFCHKVFLERRRYNGHVGIHVRNYVRRVEELPGPTTLQKGIEPPNRDDVPSRISKMDALIEIAQNSILETSTVRPNDESNGGSTSDQPNFVSIQEISAANSNHEMSLASLSEEEMDDGMTDITLDQDLNEQDGEHMIIEENMEIDNSNEAVDSKMDSCLDATTLLPAEEKNGNTPKTSCEKDGLVAINDENDNPEVEQEEVPEGHLLDQFDNQIVSDAKDNINFFCTSTLDPPTLGEVDNNSSKLKVGFGGHNDGPANNIVTETVQKSSEENALQCGVCAPLMSPEPPLQHFPTFNATSDKLQGEEHLQGDQRHDNRTGFEELRFDEIEPKYGSATAQESLSMQEVPVILAYNEEMDGAYGSSVQFGSLEEVVLNMADGNQVTTNCVWCGVEFNHEAAVAEIQPDSVGFMCPTCKAKISGQLNVLDGGSPLNSPHLPHN